MSLTPEQKAQYDTEYNEVANYADDLFRFKYGTGKK